MLLVGGNAVDFIQRSFTKSGYNMKNLIAFTFVTFLTVSGAVYAQTTPTPTSPTTPVPQQNPVPTTPTTTEEKKTDFNSPQSPVRPANVPSEDTLIKGQKSSGAVIQDTLMPSSSKKNDRMNRKKNRKGTAEMDDATKTSTQADTTKKP
jgi:hypothetical protein